MTNYKILNINQENQVVEIEVTFEDGEVYHKRMMISVPRYEQEINSSGELTGKVTENSLDDRVKGTIEGWLATYLPMREADKPQPNSKLVGKTIEFTPSVGEVV